MIKDIVDRAVSEPSGYTVVGSVQMKPILSEFESRGIRTFEVNGENYSPEALGELVDKVELEVKERTEVTEPFAIVADCNEDWIRAQINRLIPFAGKNGFILVIG